MTPVGGRPVFGPTKGHERREVPLPRFLVEELAAHVEGKAPMILFSPAPWPGAAPPGIPARRSDRGREATGIPGFHPHELRHTAASWPSPRARISRSSSRCSGHKSAVMTLDQYGHLFGDRLDVVADAMDAARDRSARWWVPRWVRTAEVVELDSREIAAD